MIPVLVLTHGELAAALLGAAESILGRQDRAAALGLEASESREAFAGRVRAAADQLGAPALVLVDLAGGTPWNAALLCGLASDPGEILAGVNLPVLLEALGRRDGPGASPRTLAADLAALGAAAFARASDLMARGAAA